MAGMGAIQGGVQTAFAWAQNQMLGLSPQALQNLYHQVAQEATQVADQGAPDQGVGVPQEERMLWESSIGERAGKMAGWGLGLTLGAISGLMSGAYLGYTKGGKIGEEKGIQFSATALTVVGGGLGYFVHSLSNSDYPLILMGISTLALHYLVGSKATSSFKKMGGLIGTSFVIGKESLQGLYQQGKSSAEAWMNRGAYLGRFVTLMSARAGQAIGRGVCEHFYRLDYQKERVLQAGSFVGRLMVPLVAATVFEYSIFARLALKDLLIASLAVEGVQRGLKHVFNVLPINQKETTDKISNCAGNLLGAGLFVFNYLHGGLTGTGIRFGAHLVSTAYSTLVWKDGAIPLSGVHLCASLAKSLLAVASTNVTLSVFSLMVGYSLYNRFRAAPNVVGQ